MAENKSKPNLYCIPGLGADHRLFSGFRSEWVSVHFLDFFEPLENESFSEYAQRMSAGINQNEPFYLMGISLGGMLATEIGHILKPKGIIYLSTLKSSSEMRPWLRLGKHVPLPGFGLFKKMVPRARVYFKKDSDFELFNQMLQNTSDVFGAWAIEQVVNWQQTAPDVPWLHINGAQDELFPPGKIEGVHIIPGRHDLTLYAWSTLNPIINAWLKDQTET